MENKNKNQSIFDAFKDKNTIFIILACIYVAFSLIANVTANKIINIYGLTVPAAVFIYALTFTLLDVLHKIGGKKKIYAIIIASVLANLFLALYIGFTVALPHPSFASAIQEAIITALANTPRIVAASLIAYFISSIIDAEIYQLWQRKIKGHLWGRVLTSNSISLLVDSLLFISIAFLGKFPLSVLLIMVVSQYIIKMGITVVSIPMIYITRFKILKNVQVSDEN